MKKEQTGKGTAKLWGRANIKIQEPIFPLVFDESKCIETHYHDFYEFEYILSGAGYHIINGERHCVSSGDMFFTNIGSAHYYETTKENPIIVINCVFNKDVLDALSKGYNSHTKGSALCALPPNMDVPYAYVYDSDQEMLDILNKMVREHANKGENYMMQMTGLLMTLLISFSRKYAAFNADSGTHSMFLYDVKHYIKEHFREEIKLSRLAELVHMNPDYLSSVFKKQFGIPITKYIQIIRINYAAALLRDSNMSVSQIMGEIGYYNEKYFREIFKEKMGKSPQQYRSSTKKRR